MSIETNGRLVSQNGAQTSEGDTAREVLPPVPLRGAELVSDVDTLFKKAAAANHSPADVVAAILRRSDPSIQIVVSLNTTSADTTAASVAAQPPIPFPERRVTIPQKEIDAANAKIAGKLKLILSPENNKRDIFSRQIATIIRNATSVDGLPQEIRQVITTALENPKLNGLTLVELAHIIDSKSAQKHIPARNKHASDYADWVRQTNPDRFPPKVEVENAKMKKRDRKTILVPQITAKDVERVTMDDERFTKFSPRHLTITRGLLEGLNNYEIGELVGITPGNVSFILSTSIYPKIPELKLIRKSRKNAQSASS